MLWYSCVTVVLVCWVTIVASRTWEEGDLRLVGGPRRYMGTVVILRNGKWGSVCDDQWEMQDAYVVCRQLGYTRAIRAATRSEFGPGNRRFWLSQVHCKGNEQRLDECPFKDYNESIPNQCTGRYRSAGVICGVAVSPATSSVSSVEKAVSDTPTIKKNKSHLASAKERTTSRRLSGRTEIKRKKEVKLVHTNSVLTMTTPAVLTQHTTLASTTWASETAITGKELLASSTPITTKSILQTTTDVQLTPSTSSPLYVASKNNIGHDDVSENVTYQDSQVQPFIIDESHDNNSDVSNNSSQETFLASTSLCNLASLGSNKTSDRCDVLLADDPKPENLEIRLTGGRYEWEGYVQVRTKEGAWGTICSDSWTLREAMVTCHQLGVYGKAKQALLASYFGGMDAPKTIYRTQCIGRESNLALCNLTWSDSEHVCSKETAVAGVTCSQHLPDLIPSLRDIEESIRLQDQPLYYLRCAMEENCLARSAYLIRNTSSAWGNNMRRLLRFSTIVHNRGLADFRPYRPRGQWEWHACHMHYHSMEVFAHYDIIDQKGNRLAEGSKASFCLEDTTCDKGVRPQYNCRGFADQGLSVNCSDNYLYDIDCQWIDISDIKPGEYTFQLEVNPTMLVAESNFDNNVVSCRLFYSGYFASFKNCRHESLLDYRENVRH